MTLEEKLKNLPDKTGVYLMKDAQGKIIYVGKAKSLRSRVSSYFRNQRHDSAKTRILVKKIADLEFLITDTEAEALILENNLIKKHKPRYNISLKDDKTYPYIKITREEYPRVLVTRNLQKDGAQYFGPFTGVGAMNETIALLQRLFPFRSCNSTTFRNQRPCLNYHIKKCYAPCAGKISREDYQQLIANIVSFLKGQKKEIERNLRREMEEAAAALDFEKAARIRDKIAAITMVMEKQKVDTGRVGDRDVLGFFQSGNHVSLQIFFIRGGKVVGRDNFLLTSLLEEESPAILGNFIKTYYLNRPALPKEILLPFPVEDREMIEEALAQSGGHRVRLMVPQRGENRELLEMVNRNARSYLEEQVLHQERRNSMALEELQRLLDLPRLPERMECYDISHTQGSENVASMVVFHKGSPDKKAYRKFKIRSVEGADDFRSMEEVLERRLQEAKDGNEKFLPLPDLIVIDGGKGQLSSAMKSVSALGYEGAFTVVSLAKKEEALFLPGRSEPIMLDRRSQALQLIQRIRDEAHRFAVTYHRSLRKKRNLESILDDIPGIGPSRKKLLLARFGSVYHLVAASQEELLKIKEIPQQILERVYNYLQQHEDLQMRIKKKEGRHD